MQIETLKQAGAIYLEQIQEGFDQCDWVEFTPVSYTHLTLPTIA